MVYKLKAGNRDNHSDSCTNGMKSKRGCIERLTSVDTESLDTAHPMAMLTRSWNLRSNTQKMHLLTNPRSNTTQKFADWTMNCMHNVPWKI